jgi:hypothetical protein
MWSTTTLRTPTASFSWSRTSCPTLDGRRLLAFVPPAESPCAKPDGELAFLANAAMATHTGPATTPADTAGVARGHA